MGVIHLDESRPFATAAKPAEGPGRFRVRIISAGVGSSGVYPAEALKAAAEARVFAAGTHMYLDHPTESEEWERPERSLRDLVGRLVTDAEYVDEDGGALDADVEVFSPWRSTIAELLETIGVSIRATAEVRENDEQGRPIIARLIEAKSVDYVTRAGRGGKILRLIESARATGRAVARGVAEATANDRREQLAALVRGSDDRWACVRDFDDTRVWFEDEDGLFEQTYATTDDVATALTGSRVPVRAVTTYVPVGESAPATAPTSEAAAPTEPTGTTDPVPVREAAPAAEPNPPAVEAGPTPPHTKETLMGTIQVDEARYAGLEEKAALVPALEAKVQAAEARAAAAEERALQAEAGTKARDFARTVVTRANAELAEASVARIVKAALDAGPLPLVEGRLDTEKFADTVEAARKEEEAYLAQIAEASGVGSVRGVGATKSEAAVATEADVDQAVARAFGRKGA